MERILAELNKTSDVLGSFIVGQDGILVASDISTEMDGEILGALAATVVQATKRMAQKLDQGNVRGIVLETDKDKLFFQKSKAGFLVVVTSDAANLGLIRVEMKAAVNKINTITLEAG